mgnify:CR=1 FL=1
MNCKKNAKSRSDDEHRLFDPAVEKVVEIGLERLRPFENHPFKVKEDEAMARLIIWYRTQYMNYIILGIAEFMLVGVLAAGAFVLALVSEVRDCVGRFIIGG